MSDETVTVRLTQRHDYPFDKQFGAAVPMLLADEPAPLGQGAGPSPVAGRHRPQRTPVGSRRSWAGTSIGASIVASSSIATWVQTARHSDDTRSLCKR